MTSEIANLSAVPTGSAQACPSRQRFLYAGIGAIVPVLLSLVVIDLKTILLDVTPLTIASYVIRIIALFAIGGLVGWLHKSEYEPTKLFQLGIAAPALVTAALNGARVSLPEKLTEPASHPVSGAFTASAYAQTVAPN